MNKLREVLKNAYETVPYYKQYLSNKNISFSEIDIDQFPIINKKHFRSEYNEFLSSSYDKKDLSCSGTSGSTGIPLKIYKSKSDELNSGLAEWMFRIKNYGIKPKDKFCSFHLFRNVEDKAETPLYFESANNLSFSAFALQDIHLKKYVELMQEFQPIWFFSMPSSLFILASYMKHNNIKPPSSIKYIELSGEYLLDNQRNLIKNVFNCPTANQYGATEVGVIAMECPHGHLHCLDNNVFLEIINDDKSSLFGEIHITSLNNYAMPIIRYQIGDKGRFVKNTENKCKCNNQGDIIEISAGRIAEYFEVDCEKINAGIFYFIIEKISENLKIDILQFQIIKKGFVFEVILAVDLETIDREQVIKEFTSFAKNLKLGHFDYNFKFVETIHPNPKIGKQQYFINEQ